MPFPFITHHNIVTLHATLWVVILNSNYEPANNMNCRDGVSPTCSRLQKIWQNLQWDIRDQLNIFSTTETIINFQRKLQDVVEWMDKTSIPRNIPSLLSKGKKRKLYEKMEVQVVGDCCQNIVFSVFHKENQLCSFPSQTWQNEERKEK
jgi:hypothetical protein